MALLPLYEGDVRVIARERELHRRIEQQLREIGKKVGETPEPRRGDLVKEVERIVGDADDRGPSPDKPQRDGHAD